jgi:hypothetical protein
MNVDGSGVHRVSTGFGKTTCGYFYDDDRKIFFGSTHAADKACPAKPDPSKGYVWGLDPYDIYTAQPRRVRSSPTDQLRRLHRGRHPLPRRPDDCLHVAQGR